MLIGASLSEPQLNVRNLYIYVCIYTSDMQGLVWGEPELTTLAWNVKKTVNIIPLY